MTVIAPKIPDGKRTGCLDRKYPRPGSICPLYSERLDVLTDGELRGQVEKGVSVRPFHRQTLDQNGVGSCAAESSSGAVQLMEVASGQEFVLLNPWFVYHTTSHGTDRGSSIDENLEFIRQYGVAPQSVWPRDRGWRQKPSNEAYDAAKDFRILEFYDITNVREAMSANALGFPVVYGANGHAVIKVALLLDDRGRFTSIDLNSWGSDWGDGGFGLWVDYDDINWRYGAWAVRTTATE